MITVFDSQSLRRVFGCFPSGVVAVCGRAARGPIGMTLSTFVPVSLHPPLVAISVRTQSQTWPALAKLPRLGLAVLSAAHAGTAQRLSAATGDRFTGVDYDESADGALWPIDAVAVLTCTVDREFDVGDHRLVVLAVNTIEHAGEGVPLVFHRSAMRPLDIDVGTSALAGAAS